MDYRIEMLFSLLLVMSHISSNLAAYSYNKNLPCHVDYRKEAHDMISYVNKSFQLGQWDNAHNYIFLIISNSHDSLPEYLQKKLDEHQNTLIMSVDQHDYVDNRHQRKKAYQNMLNIDTAKFIKILIYAKKRNDLPQILKNFTNIFKNITMMEQENKYNIAFLTKYDKEWNRIKIKSKLRYIIKNAESSETSELAKFLYKNANISKIFRESSEDKIIDNILNHLDYANNSMTVNLVFDQELKDVIICGITELASKMNPWKIFTNWINSIDNKNELQKIHKKLDNITDIATYISKAITILIQYSKYKSSIIQQILFKQKMDEIIYLSKKIPNMYPLHLIGNRQLREVDELDKPKKFSESTITNFTKNCIKMEKGYKLQIKGKNLRLSDINLSSCSDAIGFNDEGKEEDITFIELFSSYNMIIDRDLIMIGKSIQVAIFARNWIVIGERTINLNGADGKSHKESRAKDGVEKGFMNGANGLAGLPGGSAGYFYGLARTIERMEFLTILANGGNGGPGQNGGKGANGINGETWKGEPPFYCVVENHGEPECDGWKVDHTPTHYEYQESGLIFKHFTGTNCYKVNGKKGTLPGKGGNGGAGGLGGKAGEIIIKLLSEDVKKNNTESGNVQNLVKVSTMDGKIGYEGKLGGCGINGNNGKDVDVDCIVDGLGIKIRELPKTIFEALLVYPGKNGVSLKKRKIPNKTIILQNYQKTLNEYKRFVRSEMVKLKDNSFLAKFLEVLNNHPQLIQIYDTISLVEEFIGLEQDYFYYHKKLNLTSSYVALEQRLLNYVKNPHKADEGSDEYKRILKDLHHEVTEKLLISDVNKTLIYPVKTSMKRAFKSLLHDPFEASKIPERIVGMTKWLEAHIRPLEKQIKEAQYIIDVVIKNSMDDVETTLDQELDILLKEIVTLTNENVDRTTELRKSREQLKNIMMYKKCFGALKCGLLVAGIVFPVAEVATLLAASAVSVIETKVEEFDGETKAKEIPKAVKTANKAIEKLFKEKKEKEDKFIAQQEKFLEIFTNETAPYAIELISEIWNASLAIRNSTEKSIKDKGTVMKEIYDQKEIDLEKVMKNAVNEGDEQKLKKYKAGLQAIKYLKATSPLLESGSDILISQMKDDSQVDAISYEIIKSEENIEGLNSLKDQITNIADPMIQNLMGFVSEDLVRDNDENNIILNHWNITQNIKKMQRLMVKMTEGLTASDDLAWSFDLLLANFDFMTEMNEKILEYQKQKEDKFFNTGLQFDDTSYLQITDPKLRNAVAESKMYISYNTISESYNKWILAFKQFVFPTAKLDLESLERPNIFKDGNIEVIIQDLKENIVHFDNRLHDESQFDIHLKNRINQTFSGSTTPGKNAFHIWKKETYFKEIQQILTGNEVVLEAKIDLQKSPNALKFNKLKILFTSTNLEIQKSINHVIQDFGFKLIHHGDSKYKCDKNIYEIINTPTEMDHSFVNSTEDGRWHSSAMYSKIQNGDFVLSPYATWSIQLTTLDFQNFKKLKQYIGKVNLELIGQGQLSEDSNLECPINMEKYYTKIL